MNRPTLRLPAKREGNPAVVANIVSTCKEWISPASQVEPPLSILAILRNIARSPWMTKKEVQEAAALRRNIPGNTLRMCHFYTIVAKLYGYQDWSAAIADEHALGCITNKNYKGSNVDIDKVNAIYTEVVNKPERKGIDIVVHKTRVNLELSKARYELLRTCRLEETRNRISSLMERMAAELPRNVEYQYDNTRYFFRLDPNDDSCAYVAAREYIKADSGTTVKGYVMICLAIDPKTRLIVGVCNNIAHLEPEDFAHFDTGLKKRPE